MLTPYLHTAVTIQCTPSDNRVPIHAFVYAFRTSAEEWRKKKKKLQWQKRQDHQLRHNVNKSLMQSKNACTTMMVQCLKEVPVT